MFLLLHTWYCYYCYLSATDRKQQQIGSNIGNSSSDTATNISATNCYYVVTATNIIRKTATGFIISSIVSIASATDNITSIYTVSGRWQ